MKTLTVPAGEFKAKCLKLLDEVRDGSVKVIVTKRGQVVAELSQPEKQAPAFRSVVGRSPGIKTPSLKEWARAKAEFTAEMDASTERLAELLNGRRTKKRKAA